MTRHIMQSLLVAGLLSFSTQADDACKPGAIHSLADVTVSDGLTYQVEGLYKSRHRAAARFIRENGSLHIVEGPNVWVSSSEGTELASDFQRDFTLGHQFHAFFLHFEDLVSNIESVEAVEFGGGTYVATKGTRDTGGAVYLIEGETAGRPLGLRYDVGDLKIEIAAGDWRMVDGVEIPFSLSIDDGEHVFEYRYQWVDLSDKPLLWFYDRIGDPDIDAVEIERLHRKLLIAHCLGDADMMGALTAPDAVVASRGSVFETQPEEMATRFVNVFERRKYSAYIDTALPRIAAGGDVGWAAVQVNAQGMTPANGEAFDEHWAWVMMARKVDGKWLMAGNASNIRRSPQ